MAGDPEQIGQNEIEELLRAAQKAAAPSPPPAPAASSAASDAMLGQAEIEALLGGGKPAAPKPQANPAPPPFATAPPPAPSPPPKPAPKPAPSVAAPAASARPASSPRTQDDVGFLLAQAEAALASVDSPETSDLAGIAPFSLTDFGGSPASSEKATIELLRDVELNLRIELGRTQMNLEDVLRLKQGSVVTLDKLAGDPVDVYVNGRLVARGEVLVLNENFCVRVAELLSGDDRHVKQ